MHHLFLTSFVDPFSGYSDIIHHLTLIQEPGGSILSRFLLLGAEWLDGKLGCINHEKLIFGGVGQNTVGRILLWGGLDVGHQRYYLEVTRFDQRLVLKTGLGEQMEHFEMLLSIWIILSLFSFINSFRDNCLIYFLRAFQVVDVRSAVRAIDNKDLFLIRIFPVRFRDKLDICNDSGRVTSEKWIG